MFAKIFRYLTCSLVFVVTSNVSCGPNQTDTVSPILPPNTLPYKVSIELADFLLPNGLHSYVLGEQDGKWLLLTGRTNGMHTFDQNNNNFPPSKQNTDVYVIDFNTRTVLFKSLKDPTSGLSQHQVDLLSVTSAQSLQRQDTLYITGGYGVDSSTGTFSTKDVLSAIDISGLIHWVTAAQPGETAAQYIRQIHDPLVQVTGGYMTQGNAHDVVLLIFGQNFKGYYVPESSGQYTKQIRKFRIIDNGTDLFVLPLTAELPNPNYRRRDLNVVPIMKKSRHTLIPAYVALSGVFTELDGYWTVPVSIESDGSSFMPDPAKPSTFKQAMNNYVCPTISLFSKKQDDMYVLILGGISYGYFENGVFTTDNELPFINQVTTVKINERGSFSQFIMENQYPVIPSTGSNPGNPLLFGAGASFVPVPSLPVFNNSNGVYQLDKLHAPILLGYIVGGIQSTLPNTNVASDSAASPYIFKVTLSPR